MLAKEHRPNSDRRFLLRLWDKDPLSGRFVAAPRSIYIFEPAGRLSRVCAGHLAVTDQSPSPLRGSKTFDSAGGRSPNKNPAGLAAGFRCAEVLGSRTGAM